MIVFDLDDTLYLERDFAFSGYTHLDQLVQSETGVAGFGARCRALFEAGERRTIFDLARRALGLDAADIAIQTLIDAYRNHPPDITLCPDAADFLEQNPQPFGLITDGPAHMQRNKIAALGLPRWIEHLRPTGAWGEGYGKPHPRAFIEMEQIAGTADHMVYIADNPAKDFVTPKTRGWTTVQVTRVGGVHDPAPKDEAHAADIVVPSLHDFSLWVNARQ
ncbi:HAD family hydrolase [uncultured Tateyamaria sp.]|uniref:HAD family hydrolase n=1 Tax=uncultured Tateyamaria sp. TaxID=455651 RepID=UPI0026064972|nr:HAD family hydrolase [uncultured Tateyamaria sp.]